MGTLMQAFVTALYGAWLIAAGVWRYSESGSNAALGFGAAMGVMALLAASLFYKKRTGWAKILTAVTLLFVVGFFITKSAKEGVDLRVGIILVASLMEAIVVFKPSKN